MPLKNVKPQAVTAEIKISRGRIVGCTLRRFVDDSPGFDAEFVVDCYSHTLSAANVASGGLHRDIPEKKLNLLELVSGIVVEPRA